jgi:hypothetical protein
MNEVLNLREPMKERGGHQVVRGAGKRGWEAKPVKRVGQGMVAP